MLSTGFAVNFSPIPRIAPPPSGTVTDRAGSVVEWLPASAVVMASALPSPRGAVSIRRTSLGTRVGHGQRATAAVAGELADLRCGEFRHVRTHLCCRSQRPFIAALGLALVTPRTTQAPCIGSGLRVPGGTRRILPTATVSLQGSTTAASAQSGISLGLTAP